MILVIFCIVFGVILPETKTHFTDYSNSTPPLLYKEDYQKRD